MLRVTTIHASSASSSAAYYTLYLVGAPGEEPGRWTGQQAAGLGLSGRVATDDLEALLGGRDPTSGTPLGNPLVDRKKKDGTVVPAVGGFDATFSAPKSVSVWWALTGDRGVLDAHDVAVGAVLKHLERYGSTTRIRTDGRRQHPDTSGLSMATFRQTTSRADDPQLHTHVVISAKVRTADGRWWALDARYLKRHQRMLGGLYQSALRAELANRYGVAWEPIVQGQAEITGMPPELLKVFSKRTDQVDQALTGKLADFRERTGRDPTAWERAALTREAAADTRGHKTGNSVDDLVDRWAAEAAEHGWTPDTLVHAITVPGRVAEVESVTVDDVLDGLSTGGSTWDRADVLQAITDRQPPMGSVDGRRWAATLERAADRVIEECVDLDPPDPRRRRSSDGRSVWLEPVARHLTSDGIVAEEEFVLSWAMDAQASDPDPSSTVDRNGLDALQADAAAAVAGTDRLVLVVGPAGTGKTTALRAAVHDLEVDGRPVFGVAPTAKAAAVLARETGMVTDTLAKLLYEWNRPDGPIDAKHQLAAGTTIVVDEAGMLGTPSLARLIRLADEHHWRLALIGDPRQLQAVGRGGLFGELCASGRTVELAHIHRFMHPWEAAASLQLRAGNPAALADYEARDRVHGGGFGDHVDTIAREWVGLATEGKTVAVVAASNDHVDALNDAIQAVRLTVGHLDYTHRVSIAGGKIAYQGDIVATRRNDRELRATTGEPVRNRDLWVVITTHEGGALTVSHRAGHGTVTLPADYVGQHVRLGYAATEHGTQGDTVDVGLQLVSHATTQRGLYVGATRGRDANHLYVVCPTDDQRDARDVLEAVLVADRADRPAVTQRRELAHDGREPWRRDNHDAVPGWLSEERARLLEDRDDLVATIGQRAQVRQDAATARHTLQPDLDAARAAWQPDDDIIRRITGELGARLRPALRQATAEQARAGFGHRRSAQRRVNAAWQAVHDAEQQLNAVRAGDAPARERLDAVAADAAQLERLADPHGPTATLDRIDRQTIARIERLVAAIDTWASWASARPVSSRALDTALDTLLDVARHGCPDPQHGTVPANNWLALVDVVDPSRRARVHHRPAPERDPSLGIEL